AASSASWSRCPTTPSVSTLSHQPVAAALRPVSGTSTQVRALRQGSARKAVATTKRTARSALRMAGLAVGGSLQLEHGGIAAPEGHELGMRPGLDDPAAVEDHDAIRPAHGGEAMGDDDGGEPPGELEEVL